jgi:hypothetical protein
MTRGASATGTRPCRRDLGDQDLRDALLRAGDREQQVALGGERGDALLDLERQPCDRLVEKVDVREHLPDISACSVSKRPTSASRSAGIFWRSADERFA